MKLDFSRLSGIDFEELIIDLFEESEKITLEAFSTWSDGWIDARYSTPKNDNEIIIQAKNYSWSTWSTLKSKLNSEAMKIKKINPKRYIFTTSQSLTPDNKKFIKDTFSPYIHKNSDIWWKEEIEKRLQKNQRILKNHVKLWMDSWAIASLVFNSLENQLSEAKINQINENVKVYVRTKSFAKSMELLQERKYCIIAGIPWAWKTTLANMLWYYHISKGFSFIDISEDINTAFKLLNAEEKQFFYYDDFLWSNFLNDGLQKNEDGRIMSFIERIQSLPNHYIVFTTREYILKQALGMYRKFNEGDFDISRNTIDVKEYDKISKARIIYNHWYHSSIPKKIKEEICDLKLYTKIINHSRFNPKIFSKLSKECKFSSAKEYIDRIVSVLENPVELYDVPFQDITENSRNILYVLFSLWWTSSFSKLQEAYNSYLAISSLLYDAVAFKNSLKELEWTFINILHSSGNDKIITFSDPFVQDYLIHIIKNEYPIITNILKSAKYWKQIEVISSSLKGIKFYWDKQEIIEILQDKYRTSKGPSLERKLLWLSECFEYLENFISQELVKLSKGNSNPDVILRIIQFKTEKINWFNYEGFISNYVDNYWESRERIGDLRYLDLYSISEIFESYGHSIDVIYSDIELELDRIKEKAREIEEILESWDLYEDILDQISKDALNDELEISRDLGDIIEDKSIYDYVNEIVSKLEEFHQDTSNEIDYDDWWDLNDLRSENDNIISNQIDNVFSAWLNS